VLLATTNADDKRTERLEAESALGLARRRIRNHLLAKSALFEKLQDFCGQNVGVK
jgi:hypothetical protein